MQTVKQLEKRVNVISKSQMMMRVSTSKAAHMIKSGEWSYSSKSKLKSFLNKERKLHNNMNTLKSIGLFSPQHLKPFLREDSVTYFKPVNTAEKGKLIPNIQNVGDKTVIRSNKLFVIVPNADEKGIRGILTKPLRLGQRIIVQF